MACWLEVQSGLLSRMICVSPRAKSHNSHRPLSSKLYPLANTRQWRREPWDTVVGVAATSAPITFPLWGRICRAWGCSYPPSFVVSMLREDRHRPREFLLHYLLLGDIGGQFVRADAPTRRYEVAMASRAEFCEQTCFFGDGRRVAGPFDSRERFFAGLASTCNRT